MARNNIDEFWKTQLAENLGFNESHLELIKSQFLVTGRIKIVSGFPFYAVADNGRVFTCRPCVHQTKDFVRERKQSTGQAGHKLVHLHHDNKATLRQIHRLVAMEFLPPPYPHQTIVRHLDGNPSNNHYLNLAWGTQKENMEDCVRHGNTLKGIKSANAKLNDNRVVLIRGLAAEGFSISCIAEFFGVSTETVRRATVGESWGHVA